jgi:hypothetical protein
MGERQMTDTNLGPIKRNTGKLYSSGKIYYVIENDPASPNFEKTSGKSQIQDAFLCWQRASSFVFEEIPEAQRSATYPTFFPRINLRFGMVSNFFHSAETSFEGTLDEDPARSSSTTPRNGRRLREMDYSVVGALFGKVGTGFGAIAVNDLWTIAMHEIGHALGLGHSAVRSLKPGAHASDVNQIVTFVGRQKQAADATKRRRCGARGGEGHESLRCTFARRG